MADGAPVRIESRRFILRSLATGEYEEVQLAWLTDPITSRFMTPTEHTLEGVRNYVASHDNRSSFLLGIFDRNDGTFVGNHRALIDSKREWAQLGVLIGHRRYWGMGVLTEVRARVIDFLFTAVGVEGVVGRTVGRNLAVVASYLAIGFRPVGVIGTLAVDGLERDIVEFRLTKEEWQHGNRTGGT
jgi:RimJ/RimL family protein N-acetyltransferase